jgi:hypothetical protein
MPAARLEGLLASPDLTDEHRKIAGQFLREYEIVKQGMDPDHPLSQMQQ